MTRCAFYCVYLFILLAAVPVFAGDPVSGQPRELTLKQAIEAAFRLNPRMAKLAVEAATSGRNSSRPGTWLIPSLSAGSQVRRVEGPLGNISYESVIDIQAKLEINGSQPAQDKVEKLEYQALTYSIEWERQVLSRDVTKLYNEVLLSQARIATYERVLETARSILNREMNLRLQGLGTEESILDAEGRVLEYEISLESEREIRDNALLDLKILIGLPYDDPIRIAGSIDANQMKSMESVEADPRARADVRSKALQLQAKLASQKAETWARRGPTLGAIASYPVYSEGNSSPELNFSLTFPIDSWLPGTQGASAIENAKDEASSADLVLSEYTQRALKEAAAARTTLKKCREILLLSIRSEAVAREKVDLYTRLFKEGLVESIGLAEKTDLWLESKLTVLSATSALNIAVAELALAQGTAASGP